MALPESMQHHGRGASGLGSGRDARGLLIRGVITKVEFPVQHTSGDVSPESIPSVLVDVLVYTARQRTILRALPIMVQSGGYDDAEVWVPRAVTLNTSGGPFDLVGNGTATNIADMDGDHVLVGFIGGDLAQPVVLGQMPHPKSTQRPTDLTVRYDRVIAGTRVQVFNDGDVVMTPAALMAVTIADPADVVVPESVIMGTTFLTDLLAGLTEVQALLIGLGMPVTNLTTLLGQITASLSATTPYLAARLKVT